MSDNTEAARETAQMAAPAPAATAADVRSRAGSTTSPAASPTTVQTKATILHLSDLHFGLQFVQDKWDEVAHIAKSVRPDLVVVTGDLVETPWRWRLLTARNGLETLRKTLRDESNNQALRLVCIPGNHDTRLQGVLPVQWLIPLFGLFFLFALFLGWQAGMDHPHWPLATSLHGNGTTQASFWHWVLDLLFGLSVVLMLVGIGIRSCVRTNLAEWLGKDVMLTSPQVLPEIGVGLVPFDSASHGVSWARGRVPRKEMVACKTAMESAKGKGGSASDPFWLALVHHHPLPLPYDDQFERLMVMDNAGAFLNELAVRRIRLVLHGHKHHQHFARITVDPATSERVEVAVLSAGTPTRGRRSMLHRHGFNVVRIDADHRVQIQMFEAEGDGTFVRKNSFDMVPPEDQSRWRFEHERDKLRMSCRRMVCVAEINQYGDAQIVREFRGVTTTRPFVKQIKGLFRAHSDSGFVEAYRAESLSPNGPGVQVTTERKSINELEATIAFKLSGLQAEHDPIDFLTEFQNNNAFALNRWQFSQMYAGRDDFTEDIQFSTTCDLAIEELIMHVRFPQGIPLPTRIDLKWRKHDDTSDDGWHLLPTPMIVRMERQSVVQVRIPYPREDAIYQINWDLDDEENAPDAAPGAASALRLRKQLAELLVAGAPRELYDMVVAAEEEFRLELDHGSSVKFEAALFAYDSTVRALKCLVSTYPDGDPRQQSTFRYGLGIAGRSFKASGTVAFVKPHDDIRVQPTGYVKGNGAHAETLDEIPEEAIIAISLSPLDAEDWPYAVLQISCDTPGTSLTTAAERGDQSLELQSQAFRQSFTAVLPSIMISVPAVIREGTQ